MTALALVMTLKSAQSCLLEQTEHSQKVPSVFPCFRDFVISSFRHTFFHTSEFHHENSSRSLNDVILASPEGLDKTRVAGFF